jgi:hypothetical protein
MLKKDFTNHEMNCVSIELTCEDCKLTYKKDETAIKHTENICLKEQLRNESKENKRQLQDLTHQLTDITTYQSKSNMNVEIKK